MRQGVSVRHPLQNSRHAPALAALRFRLRLQGNRLRQRFNKRKNCCQRCFMVFFAFLHLFHYVKREFHAQELGDLFGEVVLRHGDGDSPARFYVR